MLALVTVAASCLYLIGLRADRIHAQRTVTEPGMSGHDPYSARVGATQGRGLSPGSVTVQRVGGIAAGAGGEGMVRRVLVARSVSRPVPALYRHHSAAYWAARYRERTRQFQNARRTLMSRPSVTEAINLAAVVYGNGSTLWALARCESKLNPNAQNASGSSGLMQFMPSTFASTPYGRFSIWSPYANALAGGWMLAQGRRSEWVC